MKKSPLNKTGKSETAKCKIRIQALLREISIIRDGGCFLRHYKEAGACGGYRNDGGLILQAEHLISRQRNISYADLNNIVCLCLRHHSFFKQQNGALYWDLIHRHIGKKRWDWIQKVLRDEKAYLMTLWDWQKAELFLKNELNKLKLKDE